MDNPTNANGATSMTGWFSFRGRARRREWWAKVVLVSIPAIILYWVLVLVGCASLVRLVYPSICPSTDGWGWAGAVCVVLIFILCVAVFLLLLPVTVRRLHDRNMSGWFLLLFFLLLFVPVPFMNWIVFIVLLVIGGCLEGTFGPNQFGADPKEKEHAALLRWLNAAQASTDVVSHGAQPDSVAQSEVSVQLKRLRELCAQGLISAAEYEEKRTEVLEKI